MMDKAFLLRVYTSRKNDLTVMDRNWGFGPFFCFTLYSWIKDLLRAQCAGANGEQE
jgi:hypothetical protein